MKPDYTTRKEENMEFIKTLWKNKTIAWKLGKSDFKNRFASTSLGSIWGFLQPFVFMLTYAIVFQYILKTGSSGEHPYAVWFFPGMAMWQWINDSIMSASNSIRTYSYLVKKVVFPVDVIPVISIIASSFVGIFLFIILSTISTILFVLSSTCTTSLILRVAFFYFFVKQGYGIKKRLVLPSLWITSY